MYECRTYSRHVLSWVKTIFQPIICKMNPNFVNMQGLDYNYEPYLPVAPVQGYGSPMQSYTSGSFDLRQRIRSDILQKLNVSQGLVQDNSPGNHDYVNRAVNQKVLQAKKGKRSLDSDNSDGSSAKRGRFQNSYGDNRPAWREAPVPPSPMGTKNEQITVAIWQYFIQNQQTPEIFNLKIQLKDALQTIVEGVFPYCGIYIVGSSMSGFGTTRSDMDICLMLSPQQIDQKREATDILVLLQRAFRRLSFITKSRVIKAKVPILKFWDEHSNTECDLNINNHVGIRNTHLLKYYSLLDWRVRPLVLFVKNWSRFHDINDARKMTISSYSFCLMIIHYLQFGCTPPVLPSLHKLYPSKFNCDSDIRQLRLNENISYQSENQKSLGDLFLGFLKYFAEFDYQKYAISVRLGVRLPRHTVELQTDNPNQWKCLCIEEPFDLSNTARSVYNEETFQRVKGVFRKSFHVLSRKRQVESILYHPF